MMEKHSYLESHSQSIMHLTHPLYWGKTIIVVVLYPFIPLLCCNNKEG